MSAPKMHDDEVDIDSELVGRLIADQFPQLRDLPIRATQSIGTVNAVYRLGGELYARLPRVSTWAPGIERECRWLPKLAPYLSLEVPTPIFVGVPADGYPLPWAIYRWIDGEPYDDEHVDDETQAAGELAQFVLELRGIAPAADAPRGGRKPLRELDAVTRAAIEAARGVIDADAAVAAWELALQAPVWSGTPVWIHTDLLRPNLLVRDGCLRAVIDFGGVAIGDPAADVIAAWSVFGAAGRRAFRDSLAADDDVWDRARGFALHQAALIIPYYAESNPAFVAMANRTVREVLADLF